MTPGSLVRAPGGAWIAEGDEGAGMAGGGLGRRFGWLWAAFTVSTVGTWLAFDAFPLVAVIVLHAGPVAVSVLAAAGLAVAAGLDPAPAR